LIRNCKKNYNIADSRANAGFVQKTNAAPRLIPGIAALCLPTQTVRLYGAKKRYARDGAKKQSPREEKTSRKRSALLPW
jgi:hypothetical protein